jgi:hypothetical protein
MSIWLMEMAVAVVPDGAANGIPFIMASASIGIAGGSRTWLPSHANNVARMPRVLSLMAVRACMKTCPAMLLALKADVFDKSGQVDLILPALATSPDQRQDLTRILRRLH